MSTAQSAAVPKRAAEFKSAQPREDLNQTALSLSSSEQKRVFILHSSEGKHIVINSRTVRVKLNPRGFNEVETLQGGVWTQLFTSPFPFDLALLSESDFGGGEK